MTNIVFSRLGCNDTLIKNRQAPRNNERVYLDGKMYHVIDVVHYPEGNKGASTAFKHKDLKDPFVYILLG